MKACSHRYSAFVLVVCVLFLGGLCTNIHNSNSITHSNSKAHKVSSDGNTSEPLLETTWNGTWHDFRTSPCDRPCKIPPWMSEYFQWHRTTLDQLSQTENWQDQELLVSQCINTNKCGGTSDRLRDIHFYLALAAKTRRLFFVRWSWPLPLEGFLLPRRINWTVPESLASLMDTTKSILSRDNDELYRYAHIPRHWLVRGTSQQRAVEQYKQLVMDLEGLSNSSLVVDPSFFFRDMFFSLFQPAPRLLDLVEQQLQALQLRSNQFVSAHIRAKYPGEPYEQTKSLKVLQENVAHAVDCAQSLTPVTSRLPIFVASDTLEALKAAQLLGNHSSYPLVSALDGIADLYPETDPSHLHAPDRIVHDQNAYYPTFVDLLIMSQSRCVSFGVGGFGVFGSNLSYNASCHVLHSFKGEEYQCPRE